MALIEPFIILTALLCGMASRAAGLPALIGYLAAGFVLYEFSMSSGPMLGVLADLGITLLLFTIGLKLEPTKLLETKVWGTTLIQMAVSDRSLSPSRKCLTRSRMEKRKKSRIQRTQLRTPRT